jgi:hypothetical protein
MPKSINNLVTAKRTRGKADALSRLVHEFNRPARSDGQRFLVQADEKLTAFLELESAVCACGDLS